MEEITTIHREFDDVAKTPVMILKFGTFENLQKLISGNFYASSIQSIRKEEKREEEVEDTLRYDSAEGASEYVSTGPAQATFSTLKNSQGGPLTIPIVNLNYFKNRETVLGNISCFYGITADCFINRKLESIDGRMKKFGDHFIIIYNFDEFLERLKVGIKNTSKTSWSYGYVKYFNEETYNGDLHLFRKRSRFSFQKEFRIYVKTNYVTSFSVDIGPINDIAKILPSEAIEHMFVTMAESGKIVNVNFR